MQPRTTEVLTHLDMHRDALDRAVATIPETAREVRPSPDKWSVAEVLEHLTLVERRIETLLRAEVDRARSAGLGAERDTSPVVPTVPVARLLDRGTPLTAGETSQPTGRQTARDAAASLARVQQTLRTLLLDGDGVALSEVVVPHPRLGPLNVYQWLVFVGAHEGRHAAQVRELAAALVPA